MRPTEAQILADTNIWWDHFTSRNHLLMELLENGRVVMHAFVVAELALASLPDRKDTIALLEALPELPLAELEEVRELIELRSLYNRGIGFVDAHLLASLLLASSPAELWTDDKRLAEIARSFGVLAKPPFTQ